MTDPRLPELLAATPVSRTWRVAHGHGFAVLRKDEPLARVLGLNRAAEPGVLDVAAAAGLSPRCLAADPGQGTLLTEWLPGRAWTAADLHVPANLDRAGRLLQRLHRLPLAGPVVDLAAAVERYAVLAGRERDPAVIRARDQLTALVAEGSPPLCFCHNDPTPGNFIEGAPGDLRLIDWEYAGLCHPGFDVAGVCLGAKLDAEQADRLLTAYLGREPTAADRRHHRAWETVGRYVTTLWEDAVASAGSRMA